LVFHDQRVRDLMDMKIFVDAGLLHIYAYPYHGVCLMTSYMLKLFCNFNRLFIFLTIFDHYAYLLSCDCMQTLILDLLDV
jgi:hypothetical protein